MREGEQTSMGTPTKVYISYSRIDAKWARAFAHSLRALGLDVRLASEQIRSGNTLLEATERSLRESDLIVTLINTNSLKPSLLFQAGAAWGLGKTIVGVVPDGFDVQQLPKFMVRRHLVKSTPEETAAELVSRAIGTTWAA